MRTVLFYRDFRRFTGGHLKVWDYYNHVSGSSIYKPEIFFSRRSIWNSSNPWLKFKDRILKSWQPQDANILFLAGMDWKSLHKREKEDSTGRPIINFIQGVRHADKKDVRYNFLKYKAVRICVSLEIEDALRSTKQVNGPVLTIQNGIDLNLIPKPIVSEEKDVDLFIVGLKQPQLAHRLNKRLAGQNLKIYMITEQIFRKEFLQWMNRSKITIFLPDETEGFYLPALEGMATGTLVICPDCVGNRSFCLHGINCYRPVNTFEKVLESIYSALYSSDIQRKSIESNARMTALKHDLIYEREAFLKVLENMNSLW